MLAKYFSASHILKERQKNVMTGTEWAVINGAFVILKC